MRFLTLFIVPVVLAGCASKPDTLSVPEDKWHVVEAPESLYRCPKVKNWPNPKTVTDVQIARLINELSTDNAICRASMEKIKKFYKDAKTQFEQPVKDQ